MPPRKDASGVNDRPTQAWHSSSRPSCSFSFFRGHGGLGWPAPLLEWRPPAFWWLRSALGHLGRQWRVRAVIADGHELITTGPYRMFRHPVYLAFLGMLLATAAIHGHPLVDLLLMIVFVIGTEIRVRAEESLLLAEFQDRFSEYLARTPWAYLPFVR